MGINSPTRRFIKRLLHRTVGERGYGFALGWAKARDIRSGTYREPEVTLIPHAVQAGETAIDVGANFGLYTYHLSQAVGPKGQIHSFEPVRFTHTTLARVIKKLGLKNVNLVTKGCGDKAETLTFAMPVQESGAIIAGLSHIVRVGEKPSEEKMRTETCEVVRLDDFLPEGIAPAFMKLDTEGCELLALRGARQMIERSHPTVLCEVGRKFMESYGLKLSDMAAFFDEMGYALYRFKGDRLIPEPELRGGNCIFIHPSRRDRFQRFF